MYFKIYNYMKIFISSLPIQCNLFFGPNTHGNSAVLSLWNPSFCVTAAFISVT